MNTDHLTGYAEHMHDEEGAYGAYGDPRRCPIHPHVAISSADGMFDGVCGACESEMSDAEDLYEWNALPEGEREHITAMADEDTAMREGWSAFSKWEWSQEIVREGGVPF